MKPEQEPNDIWWANCMVIGAFGAIGSIPGVAFLVSVGATISHQYVGLDHSMDRGGLFLFGFVDGIRAWTLINAWQHLDDPMLRNTAMALIFIQAAVGVGELAIQYRHYQDD